MQMMDAIILNQKFQYLYPIVICESRHTAPKWMKDDDNYLSPFETKKKNKKTKKFHQENVKRPGCGLRIAYDDTME